MQRRIAKANLRQSNNPILKSALFALAVTLSDASAYPQNASKPAAESKPHSERRIVVSIPDRQLALIENNRVVKTYDVAVGAAASPSPPDEFQIARRLENPTYYKPGVMIGPRAGNPLGTRWVGLNVKGLGIHGTDRPDCIGHNASPGCIRLRNRDSEVLFARVKVADRVFLIAEHTDEVAQIFGPAPASSSAQTLVAGNEARSSSADEQSGDR